MILIPGRGRVVDRFEKLSSGQGSYQNFGYVVTGNSNGSMEFKDKAGKILGTIKLNGLFDLLGMAKGAEKPIDITELSKNGDLKTVIKVLHNQAEAMEKIKTSAEKTAATIKENLPSNIKLPATRIDESEPDSITIEVHYVTKTKDGRDSSGTYNKTISVPKKKQ